MISNLFKRSLTVAISAVAIVTAPTALAQAEDVSDFYDDRTVTVVAPSGTGGSIYLYALLVSQHIGKHIPGQPDVVVESRPGGGGISGANYVDRIAPKDGTVIAELHPSGLLAPLFDRTAASAQYDHTENQWLGTLVARTYVGAVWHEVPVDSMEDMRDTPIRFGANGRGSGSYQNPRFVAHSMGADLTISAGYNSGGETNLAIERGEVQGRGNYYSGFLATNPDWIEDGKLKFLFKMGPDHPDLADVPTARSMVSGKDNLAMLALLEAPLNVGQAFYVHKDVPAERAKALRQAFMAMIQDPEFLAAAGEMNLELDPKGADYIAEFIDQIRNTPRAVANQLDQIISQ